MSETHLYIIHSAEDKALAKFLKSECEANVTDLRAFLASKAGQIPTGSDWLTEVHGNLRRATKFLLLLTPRSITRYWIWYEAGAAWMSDLPRFPIAAAGLNRNDIPAPLGAAQTLVLDDPEDAAQLFIDLGGALEDAHAFCQVVRQVSLPPPTAELAEKQLRDVQQGFGELGEPPKFLLRRMLTIGGLTLQEMGSEVQKETDFVSDMPSVERMLTALKERHFVEGDFEGRWRIKPELEKVVRKCFEPPSLSVRMIELSREMLAFAAGNEGGIDRNSFDQRFKTRLDLLREKAARDYAEGDEWLSKTPSSGGGVRGIAQALVRVAKRIP